MSEESEPQMFLELAKQVGAAFAAGALLMAAIKKEYGSDLDQWPMSMKAAGEFTLQIFEKIGPSSTLGRLHTMVSMFEGELANLPDANDEAHDWVVKLVNMISERFGDIQPKKRTWL